MIDASTPTKRDALARPGEKLSAAADYSQYAPRVITLPDGKSYTQTRFSALTGLSPIILGGMTPTSADGEIVAAAANAGYWAELAGGGMSVSYTHLTLPTIAAECRSRWSPYH